MASRLVDRAEGAGAGALLIACVAEQGSAAHPYSSSESLVSGLDSARNLADAVHFLCALHGRHPGIVDLAAGRTIEPEARAWLIAAARSCPSCALSAEWLAAYSKTVVGRRLVGAMRSLQGKARGRV